MSAVCLDLLMKAVDSGNVILPLGLAHYMEVANTPTCASAPGKASATGHQGHYGQAQALAGLHVAARYFPRGLVRRVDQHDPACVIEVQCPGGGAGASELLTSHAATVATGVREPLASAGWSSREPAIPEAARPQHQELKWNVR